MKNVTQASQMALLIATRYNRSVVKKMKK